MRHSIATVKTPKMSHFKMGLKNNRGSIRLSDQPRQLALFRNKAIFIDVTYVYSHSDGICTGKAVVSGKEYKVSKHDGIWSVN